MFDQARYSRAMSANMDEIERRLRSIEQRLERSADNVLSKPAQAANDVADVLASALTAVAERFRGGAASIDAAKIGNEAARLGNEAARLGSDAVRRLSKEAEKRPLVLLGVAVGVGILVGLAGRRR
jgi:thiamine monophosphate kinase